MTGLSGENIVSVRICPENSRALTYGFDVTPARLVTGLITEKGICKAEPEEIKKMFL
jgi:methylthioribose-1-phosphate isomerase